MKMGKLYVIGTPIGNLQDITLRALATLDKIEVLVCEDSRVASRLINKYIELGYITNKPRYLAYNEFNENVVWEEVVALVAAGKSVGLVSDAGMPAISDPGYRAIRGCLDQGLEVEIIPGVSALTTALTWSGIGGEVTLYQGFLPKGSGKAKEYLEAGRELGTRLRSARLVLYVSPHRIARDLTLASEVLGGEARVVVLREMTKAFEERVEGSVRELLEKYQTHKPKGEIVVVIAVNGRSSKTVV